MIIQTIDDLHLIRKKKPGEVTFRLPEFDDAVNDEWSRRFNELLDECGCSSGRQYIIYASPVYVVGLVALISFSTIGRQMIVAIFVGAIIITGITGKLSGLIERNRKIKELVRRFYFENGIAEPCKE